MTRNVSINLKKIGLFFILLSFFTPDGMTTIGNQDYIQNVAFLNISVVTKGVSYMYWIRNLAGIYYCVLQGMDLIKQNSKIRFSFTIVSIFATFSLWIIVGAYFNGVNLYPVLIHMAYCLGYMLLAKKSIRDEKYLYFDNLLLISKSLMIINLILVIGFPHGITTGRDYLSTPYYFLGIKNQVTPLLIMASMLLFMDYSRKKNLKKLLIFQVVILLNAILMESGTSMLCVVLMILGNMLQIRRALPTSYNEGKKRSKGYRHILIFAILLSVGIVFFNVQNIFSWLIVGLLNKDLSLSGRTTTWKLAIDQFLTKPILGYGYGHMVTGHYYAHNLILELLVTTGIVGFVLYAMIALKTFKRYFADNENSFSVPMISALIALVIANIGESFIFNISQLTIFILVGFAVDKKRLSVSNYAYNYKER